MNALRLSTAATAGSLLQYRHCHTACAQDEGSSGASLVVAGAAGAAGIVAAGAGLLHLAQRSRESDAVSVIMLSPQEARATTYATRLRDGHVRVVGSASVPISTADDASAEVMMGSVGAAVKAAGGSTPACTVVAVSSDLLSTADSSVLGKLAGLVEKTGGKGAELHGLSAEHEASYTLTALHHLRKKRASGDDSSEEQQSAGLGGVVVSTGGGKALVVAGGSSGAAAGGVVPIATVACDVPGKGLELLVKQGGTMGSNMFEWHVKKVVANATRRSSGGPKLTGNFVLVGGASPGLLKGSVVAAAPTDSSSSSVGDGALSKTVLLQRLEGESAALQQWLRLLEEAGDDEDKAACSELQPSSVASKQSSLAHAVALKTLVDLAFDPRATFTVAPSSSSPSGGSGGAEDLVAMGMYLETRSK